MEADDPASDEGASHAESVEPEEVGTEEGVVESFESSEQEEDEGIPDAAQGAAGASSPHAAAASQQEVVEPAPANTAAGASSTSAPITAAVSEASAAPSADAAPAQAPASQAALSATSQPQGRPAPTMNPAAREFRPSWGAPSQPPAPPSQPAPQAAAHITPSPGMPEQETIPSANSSPAPAEASSQPAPAPEAAPPPPAPEASPPPPVAAQGAATPAQLRDADLPPPAPEAAPPPPASEALPPPPVAAQEAAPPAQLRDADLPPPAPEAAPPPPAQLRDADLPPPAQEATPPTPAPEGPPPPPAPETTLPPAVAEAAPPPPAQEAAPSPPAQEAAQAAPATPTPSSASASGAALATGTPAETSAPVSRQGPSLPAAPAGLPKGLPARGPTLPAKPAGITGLPARPAAGAIAAAPKAAAGAATAAGDAATAANTAVGTAATAAGAAASAAGPAAGAAGAAAPGGPSGPGGPVGLTGLPARPGPARPAGGLSGLPARPTPSGGTGPAGITGLPARPTASSTQPPPAATPAPPAPTAAAPAATPPSAAPQPPAATPADVPPASAGPSASSGAGGAAARPSLPARGLGRPMPARPQAPAPPAAPAASAAPAAAAPTPAPPPAAAAAPAAPSGPTAPVMRPGFLSGRPAGPPSGPAAGGSQLAPSASAQPTAEVVDPAESRSVQKMQRSVQDVRVTLIRAAMRLGLRHDSESVTQYLQAIERVERLAGEGVYRSAAARRVDLNRAAEREAREAEAREAADSKLDVKIKIMLIGMTGTGKSQLINALLGRSAQSTSAFKDATKRVTVVRGSCQGIQLEFIDTPGLHASASSHAHNKEILKAIKKAYKKRKPHYVFYVDRLDAAKAALGELSLLSLLQESLGATVWRQTMVVLTHAHAARSVLGPQYASFLQQRKHYMQQLIRQAAGDMQARNPFHLVDSHPGCPTNSLGQAVVIDGAATVAWKQAVLMMLVGYRSYEQVQALFIKAAKSAKGGKGAKPAAKPQDMFKQMMRGRLPPMTFFVEQMTEGVLKPDTWACLEDPFGQETEDEEAEEFQHVYYSVMYSMAAGGHAGAQREYAAMLRKMNKIKQTYNQEMFENEDLETLVAAGYEGLVSPGLDMGVRFEPEDLYGHRYVYTIPEAAISIMPTMDYYGFEHEDAITGFVAEWEGQPFNKNGWGGIPLDVTVTIEKDKSTTCFQAEGIATLVHAVEPFSNRHISQVRAACELLRPNLKDVLYQLEVNTFRDGLLMKNDHAGVGGLLTRLGEAGKVGKGPVGMGVRLQETFGAGPFQVEAVAAKVQCDTPTGTKEEGWGGRAFVAFDWLPGLGMIYDFYQERTPDNADALVGGWAANFTQDFSVGGVAGSAEVDYVAADTAVHVNMNLFSMRDYRLGWLLLLPAWNYARGMWSNWRSGGPGEEEVVEEGEEEQEEEEAEE